MKESRWRSLSIMDLHLLKRGSLTQAGAEASSSASEAGAKYQDTASVGSQGSAAGGQSYELIKSTQSLVERLNLNADEITIQAVHPSIIGQDTWFQITYTSSGTTRYFSCQSARERDEWMQSLKKTLMWNKDRRRTENTLRLDILEAKGLTDKKKKYYVEILVDDKLYARTSSKKLGDLTCCFWGEQFEFKDLPPTNKVSLLIYKDKGTSSRNKPKKPVGRVKISMCSIQSRYIQDKWYTVEKSSRRESPSIRLKCQYQGVEILPLRDYEDLLYFLKDEYKELCKLLEPNISVKVKEELSVSLMSVFHYEEMAEDVLADIVVDEISSVENEHLTFRGNSIATKAMESYIKLVGQKYLQDTFQTVINELLTSDMDLEIDPVKVSNSYVLSMHQQSLTTVVRQVWNRIAKSHSYFPIQLQRCFYKIRQFLKHVGKPDLGDNLISSCIFLRYLCPAILAPSLFHLTNEYPSERANRNLTLIAKTLQTLANFTRYEGKENSMEFLNPLLEEESGSMRTFLRQISSPLAEDGWIPNLSLPVEKSELGRHLSCLHTILSENISTMETTKSSTRLRILLDGINAILHRPSIPQLEEISRPTLKTLQQIQTNASEAGSVRNERTFSGITLPWIGTLPKKSKAGNGSGNGNNMSHPAPHHKTTQATVVKGSIGGGGAATTLSPLTTTAPPISSDTSSSSASHTPSPGCGGKAMRRSWIRGNGEATSTSSSSSAQGGGVLNKSDVHVARPSFPVSMSHDETDSSDDSTYSSQYQSDQTSTAARCKSHTLPRQLMTGAGDLTLSPPRPNNASKSLSDYEQEILELRTAMEQLQMKLMEAERKLSNQHGGQGDEDGANRRTSASERQGLAEAETKQIMLRLLREEDILRREQLESVSRQQCECAIAMQQQKLAAIEDLNERLLRDVVHRCNVSVSGPNVTTIDTGSNTVSSPVPSSSSSSGNNNFVSPSSTISSLSSKSGIGGSVTVIMPKGMPTSPVQEAPKTVDELLDSLHSTPI